MIRSIDHIPNVSDLKRAIDFYTCMPGFEQLQTIDCGDFSMTNNTLPSGFRLELFNYHPKNQSKPRGVGEVALRHPAVGEEDVAENDKRLCAEELEIILPTCDIPDL